MATKQFSPRAALFCAAASLSFAAGTICADEVQMQNGDHYTGSIVSVSTNVVVMQSDVLGRILLPRLKVATISFGAGTPKPTQAPAQSASPFAPAATPRIAASNAPMVAGAETNADLSAALKNLGSNTNFIGQIRSQMLGAAGPDANKKFDDMVGDLMSGKMDVNSLRAQAAQSAQQLRDLKASLGGEAGESLDAYLQILDSFLKETEPQAATNASAPPVPKPALIKPGN